MYKENQSLVRRLLRSKILIVAEIIVLVGFSSALAKEVIRKHQVEKEVEKLQQELSELEQKNIELDQLTEYFSSDSYKEEQARTKLGLQKPGEKIITVLGDSTEVNGAMDNENALLANNEENNLTNPQKWWSYFFGLNKET